MENQIEYFAFISHSHKDKKWAKWLQHRLEHYKLPTNLNGRSDLPKEIRPVFRDISELAAGKLKEEIENNLYASKFLIVICSPNAAKSEYVDKEIKCFIEWGRIDNIIPFIIGGVPYASELSQETEKTKECFPPSLVELHKDPDKELLGINVSDLGRNAAAVKVVAQMFGLKFDELWRRFEREQKRKKRFSIIGIFALVMAMLGVAGLIWRQEEKNWKIMEHQARSVAEKIHELDKDNSRLGSLVALEILPEDLAHPNRPYTLESEFALRRFAGYYSVSIPCPEGSYIRDISFSPNGEQCAVTVHNIVLFYNQAGKLVDSLAYEMKDYPHKGINSINPITDFAYSPDGKYSAFSLYEKVIVQNNLSKINDTIVIGQKVWAVSLSFNPENNNLFFSTDDRRIGIVDICNHEVHYVSEYGSIQQIQFSPNGNLAIFKEQDNSVKLWNVSQGTCSVLLNQSDTIIRTLAFSHDGKYIIVSSDDKTVKVFDSIGNLISVLHHPYPVTCAAISNDNRYIVSGSYKTLRLWDISSVSNPKEINIINHKKDTWIYNLTFDSKDKYIAYSHGNEDIVIESFEDLFRTDDNWLSCVNFFAQKGVKSAVFSPDDKFILTSSTIIDTIYYGSDIEVIPPTFNCQNSVTIWDANTGEEIKTIEKTETKGWLWFKKPVVITPATFSPDGRYIAYAADTIIKIYDPQKECLQTITNNSIVNYVSFSPSGKQLAFVSADSTIKIIDITTKDVILNWKVDQPLDYVSFSHKGDNIAAAGEHGCVIKETPQTVVRLASQSRTNPSGRISFFPDDSRYLLLNHSLAVAIVENNFKGPHQNNLFNHQYLDTITSVTIDPTGKFFVMSFVNHTIQMADPTTGIVLCKLKHNGPVISVCFNQRGDKIMSVTSDGSLYIWDFPPLQDLIDQTRERFRDNPLSPEERRQYYLE